MQNGTYFNKFLDPFIAASPEVPQMPMRAVSLSRELDHFVASRVKSGHYANASEVMRSALGLLEQEEREHEEQKALLRAAIEEGLASGDAEPGIFERLYAYIDELTMEQDAEEDQCGNTAYPSLPNRI